MPRSYSEDQWELLDLPRRLTYEQSNFENPYIGSHARAQHAALLKRQIELKARIRRETILDRWVMRKYPRYPRGPVPISPISPLTPMKIDEVIEHGKIVDRG